MTNDYRRISAVVSGWWGAGKSWLLDTMPGPRLVLDAEGGVWDTPSTKWVGPNGEKVWDPRTEPPEVSGDISVVCPIREWHDFENAMQWLLSGQHPFESVTLDSAHELQNQLKRTVAKPGDEYNPNATFEMQAWGRLKNHMGLQFRKLRDLTQPDAAKPVNVAIACAADEEKMPHTLLLEGAIRKEIAGFFDLVGYLTTGIDTDNEEVRLLQISPSEEFRSKCRLHLLKVANPDGIVVDPDFKKILRTINAQEKSK